MIPGRTTECPYQDTCDRTLTVELEGPFLVPSLHLQEDLGGRVYETRRSEGPDHSGPRTGRVPVWEEIDLLVNNPRRGSRTLYEPSRTGPDFDLKTGPGVETRPSFV